jgi:hypothetical protein
MGDVLPPGEDPLDDEVRSAVLEDEEGEPYVVDQQNAGPESEAGSGEWPETDVPPVAPAPGSAGG